VRAVGRGGIYIEIFKDVRLRVLPVSRAEVQAMLDELHGKALLQGARGSQPANLDALTDAIVRVAQVAQALGDDLESLEINPLRVDGSQIEALDVKEDMVDAHDEYHIQLGLHMRERHLAALAKPGKRFTRT